METPSTTRATKARRASSGDKERTGGPGTAAPPHPQRGTVAYNGSAGTLIKHTAGTEGARPEHGVLPCCEYDLLAPTGLVVNPAATGNQGSVDGHEATRGTVDQAQRETEAGDRTQKHAFPARSMQGADDKERRPHKR